MSEIKNYLTPAELAIIFDFTLAGVYRALEKHKVNIEILNTNRKRIPPSEIRRFFEERGFKYPNKNISFQIVKGGVGKTSLSYGLGLRASYYGAKVLLIDLDQQANLTRSFKIGTDAIHAFIKIFKKEVSVNEALIKINQNLDIIPSSLSNSRLDIELNSLNFNPANLINDIIKPIRDQYDLVIIDCPPAINKICLAATCASNEIIIPINPDPYAMDGLDFTLNEISRIKENFNLNLDYKIVWNKYDAREKLSGNLMVDLAKDEKKAYNVMPIVIRVDANLRRSISEAVSIYELQKKSNIQADIDQFTKEILGITEWIKTNHSHHD